MKTCPVCALDLEDTYLFCPDDGSSLGSLPDRSAEGQFSSASGSDDEKAGAVVLYCPACAAEYPLTFSSCPVHALQLTKHRIPRLSSSGSGVHAHFVDAQATLARPRSELTKARPDLEGSQRARANIIGTGQVADNEKEPAPNVDSREFLPDAPFVGSTAAFDYPATLTGARERAMERPGFRVAAIAIVIVLAVFGLVALYTLASNLTRRSPSNVVRVATNAETVPESLPFVPTPREAQDYKEEAPISSPPVSSAPQSVRPVDRARNESLSPSQPKGGALKNGIAPTAVLSSVASSPSAPVVTTRVSNPPMPALPRGPSGGFDARLIRVRSAKTSAGVRYDLTFNMQEQAGRSAQWQRVLITTRSANGTSHSEAIPFSHRLGAAGALTFTISVEMTGRSEADWQGRIVCTTLGWDNKGAPLQTSFGASVAP